MGIELGRGRWEDGGGVWVVEVCVVRSECKIVFPAVLESYEEMGQKIPHHPNTTTPSQY